MAGGDDWRQRRAIELGLEPYGRSLAQRPLSSVQDQTQAPSERALAVGRGNNTTEDGVTSMRMPPAIRSDMNLFEDSRAYSGAEARNVPLARKTAATDGQESFARHRSSKVKARSLGGRTQSKSAIISYAAVALTLAASGGAWIASRQAPELVPPPNVPIEPEFAPLGQTVAAAPPAAAPERELRLVNSATGCDAPETLAELRTAVSDKLQRSSSNLVLKPPVLKVGVGDGRPKIGDVNGPITVCTAALSVRRGDGRSANYRIDYAIQRTAEEQRQIVPLGFDHVADNILTDARNEEQAARATPSTPKLEVAKSKLAANTPLPAPIVVVPKAIVVKAGPLADTLPTEIRLPSSPDLSYKNGTRLENAAVPRGCEKPETLSVAITCKDKSLLALNAQVAAVTASLEQQGNERTLALIKRRADDRFDRCQTRLVLRGEGPRRCVGTAYRYWLNELANLVQDRRARLTGDGTAGSSEPLKEYTSVGAPQP